MNTTCDYIKWLRDSLIDIRHQVQPQSQHNIQHLFIYYGSILGYSVLHPNYLQLSLIFMLMLNVHIKSFEVKKKKNMRRTTKSNIIQTTRKSPKRKIKCQWCDPIGSNIFEKSFKTIFYASAGMNWNHCIGEVSLISEFI